MAPPVAAGDWRRSLNPLSIDLKSQGRFVDQLSNHGFDLCARTNGADNPLCGRETESLRSAECCNIRPFSRQLIGDLNRARIQRCGIIFYNCNVTFRIGNRVSKSRCCLPGVRR